jgi:hypothetical protein
MWLQYNKALMKTSLPFYNILRMLSESIPKWTKSQVGEVLLKDKFLTQSASDICRKLQKFVAEGEKSLDQLMQLAMSVYYNWDLTKKREKDKNIMTQPQPSGSAPPDGGLHPEFATIEDRVCHSTGNAQKGDSLGDSPSLHQDLAPSAKVTTGGLSAAVSRQKAGCHLLWTDGSLGLLSRLQFLTPMLRSLR